MDYGSSDEEVDFPPAKQIASEPSTDTSDPPLASPPEPTSQPSCPTQERQELTCFDPESYGLYRQRKEVVANAYEDLINNVLYTVNASLELTKLSGIISDDAHIANTITSTLPELPDSPSLKEVLAGPEQHKWHRAILDKLAAIKDVTTWTLVDYRPNIRNVIGCWFVLQKKHRAYGEVTRYKAQLVAQGFSQCKGVGYSKTFTPIIKSVSFCVFLAICTQHGWLICQMDIKSTYLNGLITEDIYMRQPVSYEEKGSKTKVAKLQRGLYGLKQAGHEWYV